MQLSERRNNCSAAANVHIEAFCDMTPRSIFWSTKPQGVISQNTVSWSVPLRVPRSHCRKRAWHISLGLQIRLQRPPHPSCPRTMTTKLRLPNYGSNTLPHKNGLEQTFLFIHAAPFVHAVSEICFRHRAQTGSASPPWSWASQTMKLATHLKLVPRLRLHGSLSDASIRLLR
jgi:hypothetical protein